VNTHTADMPRGTLIRCGGCRRLVPLWANLRGSFGEEQLDCPECHAATAVFVRSPQLVSA